MTIETLQDQPIGVLESRIFTLNYTGHKHEEHYYLVKGHDSKYFIGFSTDGTYCSNIISEEYMLYLINSKDCSDKEALGIYITSPQLSCWIDD